MSFDPAALRGAAQAHGTPLYVYDIARPAQRVGLFRSVAGGSGGAGFDAIRYAVKANPSLAVLASLRRAGAVCDCVSAGEVERALAAGFRPEEVVYTSDVLDRAARKCVGTHRLHVNAGTASMIDDVAAIGGFEEITLRINPGFGDGHDEKVTTGGPRSKHGIWYEDLPGAVALAGRRGLAVTGLHVHIGSGAGTVRLQDTISAMERAVEVCRASVRRVSCGGGMAVPYRSTDPEFDLAAFAGAWFDARERWSRDLGRRLELEVEPGRYLVADCGVLLTEVCGVKSTGAPEDGGQRFILVDAGFHSLVRPMLYGAFHRITALGREGEATEPQVVAGPLCESSDVFTQGKQGVLAPQDLPRVEAGDLLVIHDVGAYGASMASSYNSRPLPAEAILRPDGRIALARPALDLSRLVREELELLPPELR